MTNQADFSSFHVESCPVPSPAPWLVAVRRRAPERPRPAHRDLPPEAMYSIRLRCWGWTPRIALPREIEDGTHLTRPFRLGKPSLNLVHWLK